MNRLYFTLSGRPGDERASPGGAGEWGGWFLRGSGGPGPDELAYLRHGAHLLRALAPEGG